MPRVEKIANVPEDELAELLKDYALVGATVDTTKQADGNYTVTATIPDEAPAEKKPPDKKPPDKKPIGKKPAGKKPAGKKPAGKKPTG